MATEAESVPDVWSVADAEHLLRVNAGTSPESGGPNYDPQLLLALDSRLAEPAALFPEGMVPLRALAEKHPFEEMRSTPQAVLDRQGFLMGTDESVEMYWVRSDAFLEAERRTDLLDAAPAKNLWIPGERWKDFLALSRTFRGISMMLALEDEDVGQYRPRDVFKAVFAALGGGNLLTNIETPKTGGGVESLAGSARVRGIGKIARAVRRARAAA
jgi:hypothetical protein